MNEIDFSLERIDFALRRRFIWERHDYSEDALETIINDRLKNNDSTKDVDIDSFINCCTALNSVIDKEDSLGSDYHIGHAFFAEITEIYRKLQEDKDDKKASKNWTIAKTILWEVSIKPTLEAYCGAMDKQEKNVFIDKCLNTYKGDETKKDAK